MTGRPLITAAQNTWCPGCGNFSIQHALKNVLESGVATGGICALVMNWFLPEKK